MKTTQTCQPAAWQVIVDIEEAVENANLLAMELVMRSCETDQLNGTLSGDLAAMQKMADRAMTATNEIGKLVRELQCH